MPGLERTIPKNKGVEFGSLLHQLGAEVVANPFSTNLHKLLLEIAPDAKERFPKRHAKKAGEAEAAEGAKKPAPSREKAEPPAAAAKAAPAPTKKKPEPGKKPAAKKPAASASKAASKKPSSGLAKKKPR